MFEGPIPAHVKPYVSVRVCTNRRLGTDDVPSCGKRGSLEVITALEAWIAQNRLPVQVIKSPCMNACADGPNMRVVGGDWFSGVQADDLEALKAHILDRVAAGGPSATGGAMGGKGN